MTNKRITELTALDGDDVADNDVLAIVDVSDTTMAASGTTKKITVAELVTDSALTNKFWPNSTTALTGANLANGDKLAVVDVGSPDVPKYITADELAQGSQFSSRYAPKATTFDRLWIPAAAMDVIDTAPTLSAGYLDVVWLLDASSDEGVGSNFVLPTEWATFHIDLYWSAAATTGDVYWVTYVSAKTVGESTTGAYDTYLVAATVAANADRLSATRMKTGQIATAGAFFQIGVVRQGSSGADTMSGDARLHGVLLTRAS
jgi:hypothetical protein